MKAGPTCRRARQLLYWTLPPVLLWQVLSRVDLVQMAALIGQARPGWWVAGLAGSGLVVLLGALRWQLLVAPGWAAAPSLREALPDYWRGLAVGLLVPGSLGQDGYRALRLVGRGCGMRSAVVRLLLEKLLALAACTMMAVSAAASLHRVEPVASLGTAVTSLVIALLVALAAVQYLPQIMRRLTPRLPHRVRELFDASGAAMERVTPAWPTLPAIAGAQVLSLVILIVSALQAQCYLQALGVEVDFRVNLLCASLLFLVLALPISVGGFGVREAAHLALYGAFGVPSEAALALSLCTLFGLALNWAVGALLLYGSRGAADLRAQGHELVSSSGSGRR